jgi:tetratricopeptide (TPR) repeat protein
MLGNPTRIVADGNQLRSIIDLLKEAESLDYSDKDQILYYEQTTADAIFTDAQKKLKSGDEKAALGNVAYLLELNPSNQKMRENAANLAYRIGEFASAKANYEQLIKEGYTGEEESVVATGVKDGVVSTFPNKKAAEYAVMSGDFKDVRIEKSESQLGPILTNLVWLYNNDGEKEKAEKTFLDMTAKYPNDENLKIASADIYLILGMKDEYEKAVKSMNAEINDPQVFENLGVAAAEKENWDQAIDYYQKSLDIKADNFLAQNNIAVAYINKGNLDETSADDQKVLYTKATTHLEKVLELKPDQASAVQTLIGLYDFLDMKEKSAVLKAKM